MQQEVEILNIYLLYHATSINRSNISKRYLVKGNWINQNNGSFSNYIQRMQSFTQTILIFWIINISTMDKFKFKDELTITELLRSHQRLPPTKRL